MGEQAPSSRPGRKFVPVLLWLASMAPVLAVILANPMGRIYSHHGFIHASIIYRIANGEVPPSHPFMGDQPLPYYWGYHWLAAQIVRLGTTPFWAGAWINLAALGVTLVLAWEVTGKLCRVENPSHPGTKASSWRNGSIVLAGSVGALCAPSFLPPGPISDLLRDSQDWGFMDPRALPIVIKYLSQSGMPLGALATLLWIRSLIGLYEGHRPRTHGFFLCVSMWLCAFFYPPMLPSLVLGTPTVALIFLIRCPAADRQSQWKRAIYVCLLGALGVVFTLPYLLQVAESLRGGTLWLHPPSMLRSLKWLLLLCVPTFGYLYLHRKVIRTQLSSTSLTVLAGLFLAASLLFLSLNQPLRTEYKYLSAAMIALGFVGGATVALAWRWTSVVSWTLGLVFLVTPTYALLSKLNYQTDKRMVFMEQGSALRFIGDKEKGDLFDWVRENTPVDALFLDPTGVVPIYGQRGLLMGPNKRILGGFGGNPYEFLRIHDQDLIESRTRVLDGAASPEQTRQALQVDVPVYRIVDRLNYDGAVVDPSQWVLVHKTPRARFRIYSWQG